jgi:hypothetical protein
MNLAKRVSLFLCLTMLLLAFTVAAQAAGEVKIGRYANDGVMNGEFKWHIILKADKTFEFVTGDYEGVYTLTGTWKSDNSGNVTINIKGGDEPVVFTGGGTDTLTLTAWPYGQPVNNTPFHYDAAYTAQ